MKTLLLITIQSLIAILFFLSSCTSTRYVTQTKRSGIEQLLVTKAIDRAIAKIDNLHINGCRVFFEIASLAKDQEAYLKKALTHWFLENGAIVVDERNQADLIASVLVKCAGTDRFEAGLAIPSLPVPFTSILTPKINILTLIGKRGAMRWRLLFIHQKQGNFKKI